MSEIKIKRKKAEIVDVYYSILNSSSEKAHETVESLKLEGFEEIEGRRYAGPFLLRRLIREEEQQPRIKRT